MHVAEVWQSCTKTFDEELTESSAFFRRQTMDYSRIKIFSVAQHRVVGGSIKGLVWAVLLFLAAGRLLAQTGGTGSILGSVVE
jgi:hypothetical protein